MITSNIENFSSMSMVNAKVEIYEGSTLVRTCTCSDFLSDYSITREGDTSKFFGFGICHKLNLVLIDLHREISLFTNYTIEIALGNAETNVWDYPYPTFYINEIDRNEKDSTITVTAFDILHDLSAHRFEELFMTAPYTLKDVTNATATKFLNTSTVLENIGEDAFALSYEKGANLEGTENLRFILNAIAEVTLTIYFINHNNQLVFKRLKTPDLETDIDVTPDTYYELNILTPRTLTAICSATELGDNLTATASGLVGVTQYIRNNPFLDLRTDRADLLDNAIADMAGFTIYQFDLDWSGDYRVEIGDLLGLVDTDNHTVYSYVLSDTIVYGGTFNQVTEWNYTDNSEETASNPTSIKEMIDKTYAKVDKMEKEITLYVGEVVDTVIEDRVDTALNDSLDNFDERLNTLQGTVNAVDGKINEVEDDISGLQEVQLQHSERFSKLELTTQGIEATVSSLTETTEVLKDDLSEVTTTNIPTAKQEAIDGAVAEVESMLEEVVPTATKDYVDSNVTTLNQIINSKEASIKVTTDAITQRLTTTEEILSTKADSEDVYNKTEVYTKTETDSQIKTTKDAITLSVSNTYETKASATTKASNAEKNANKYTDEKVSSTVTTMNNRFAEIDITTDSIEQRVSQEESKTVEIEGDIEELNSTVTTTTEGLSQLSLNSHSISASVQSLEQTTSSNFENVSEELNSIQKKLSTTMTTEEVGITISKTLENGVDRVTTKTGFTFNDEGLHISKSNSQMESLLDETGLLVSRYDTPVLVARAEGVNALNLTSRQYLSVAGSRFEKYGKRTACFWVGE